MGDTCKTKWPQNGNLQDRYWTTHTWFLRLCIWWGWGRFGSAGMGGQVLKGRYEKLKAVAAEVQTAMGVAASYGERLQSLLSWRDPRWGTHHNPSVLIRNKREGWHRWVYGQKYVSLYLESPLVERYEGVGRVRLWMLYTSCKCLVSDIIFDQSGWGGCRATAMFILFCLALAILMYLLPIQLVLLVWGMWAMRHPSLRPSLPTKGLCFVNRLPSLADSVYWKQDE